MRVRAVVLTALVLASASPSWAAKEWYDYYLEARDRHIPGKKWAQAIASLQEATKRKEQSGLDERTYGLQFVDYLPYYYRGVAHLRLGEHGSALTMFNIERSKGLIQKTSLLRDLDRLSEEARAGFAASVEEEKQRRAQQQVQVLRGEVERLLKESAELERGGRYDDALLPLARTEKAAEFLDPAIKTEIQARVTRIREAARAAKEAGERTQRIDQQLAEGQKRLEAGDSAGAKLGFDAVLALDPQNAKALEGKQRAELEILARTTEASRLAQRLKGKELAAAGRYEEARRPLADAAADTRDLEAQRLLASVNKALEGIRKQKDDRSRVDTLLGDAERAFDEKRYAEAVVRLESVLEIDDTIVGARDKLLLAQRRTADEVIGRIFPPQPPALTFFEPATADQGGVAEVEGKRVMVVGVATDDRGVARLEFHVGGRRVADETVLPDPGTGELTRNRRFEHELDLENGRNEIKVIVTDGMGLTTEHGFVVDRRLRPYEHAAFWPSAAGAATGLFLLGYGVQRARRQRALRRRFNPYIAGAPVRDQDMFFGRQKLLTRILNVLHHNSLMITGERRIGKTSFLHHLKRALELDVGTDFQFFPVTTDLQGVPEDGFFHAVMSDVVETLRPQSLGALRYRAEAVGYEGRDFSHDLQRVVEELATRTPKKVKLALLIDEVDVLNEYSERINQRLRSIFMKTFSEHLVAVMSGVGIKRIWKSEGSPWYNFFDEVELSAFSREEAEALIRHPVEGVFRWEPEAVERILGYSELKPYVIQKFCIHAVNCMLEHGRTTISAADVESVRDTVQRDATDLSADDRRQHERRASA